MTEGTQPWHSEDRVRWKGESKVWNGESDQEPREAEDDCVELVDRDRVSEPGELRPVTSGDAFSETTGLAHRRSTKMSIHPEVGVVIVSPELYSMTN